MSIKLYKTEKIRLSRGPNGEIRSHTVRDILKAQQIASKRDGELGVAVALISLVTRVDGHDLTYEEAQEFSQADMELIQEAMERVNRPGDSDDDSDGDGEEERETEGNAPVSKPSSASSSTKASPSANSRT